MLLPVCSTGAAPPGKYTSPNKLPVTSPDKSPVTLPNKSPVTLPVTLPKNLCADASISIVVPSNVLTSPSCVPLVVPSKLPNTLPTKPPTGDLISDSPVIISALILPCCTSMLPISTVRSVFTILILVNRPVDGAVTPIGVASILPPVILATVKVAVPSTCKLRSTVASTLIVKLLIVSASKFKSPSTCKSWNVLNPVLVMSPVMSPTNLAFAVIVSASIERAKWSTITVLSVPKTLPLIVPSISSMMFRFSIVVNPVNVLVPATVILALFGIVTLPR